VTEYRAAGRGLLGGLPLRTANIKSANAFGPYALILRCHEELGTQNMMDLNERSPHPCKAGEQPACLSRFAYGYIRAAGEADGGERLKGTWKHADRVRRLIGTTSNTTIEGKQTTCSRLIPRAPYSRNGPGACRKQSALRRQQNSRLGATRQGRSHAAFAAQLTRSSLLGRLPPATAASGVLQCPPFDGTGFTFNGT